MCVCMHACMHVCMCVGVCVYIYVYIYVYVCMYVCMYVCICTYIVSVRVPLVEHCVFVSRVFVCVHICARVKYLHTCVVKRTCICTAWFCFHSCSYNVVCVVLHVESHGTGTAGCSDATAIVATSLTGLMSLTPRQVLRHDGRSARRQFGNPPSIHSCVG